jgi:hypothetical protein
MAGDRVDVLLSTVGSFASTRPDNPWTQTGIRAEFTHHGIGSRLGKSRTDTVHHLMDPFIVFGPWIVGAELTRRTVRRLARRR